MGFQKKKLLPPSIVQRILLTKTTWSNWRRSSSDYRDYNPDFQKSANNLLRWWCSRPSTERTTGGFGSEKRSSRVRRRVLDYRESELPRLPRLTRLPRVVAYVISRDRTSLLKKTLSEFGCWLGPPRIIVGRVHVTTHSRRGGPHIFTSQGPQILSHEQPRFFRVTLITLSSSSSLLPFAVSCPIISRRRDPAHVAGRTQWPHEQQQGPPAAPRGDPYNNAPTHGAPLQLTPNPPL
jgi:hypothetical protein